MKTGLSGQRKLRFEVRAPRFPLDLTVTSNTIGVHDAFRLSTVNISRSGLLLSWKRASTMPFNEKTILELIIDPDGQLLSAPIRCLGKVVRRVDLAVSPGVIGTHLGVQIIHMGDDDNGTWEQCFSDLEARLGKAKVIVTSAA